jgi:hypothetical protein
MPWITRLSFGLRGIAERPRAQAVKRFGAGTAKCRILGLYLPSRSSMFAAGGGAAMKKIAFFVLAMGLALPAFAGDEVAEKPKKKKEKKVCKPDTASYSRMGGRICKTAAEWAGQARPTEQATEKAKGAPN